MFEEVARITNRHQITIDDHPAEVHTNHHLLINVRPEAHIHIHVLQGIFHPAVIIPPDADLLQVVLQTADHLVPEEDDRVQIRFQIF